MKLTAVAVAAFVASIPTASEAKLPPLRDPVFLNIGFVCQWQDRCIRRQQSAMRRSLAYVEKHDPPEWKIQLCNRNASRNRGKGRVDWIGYNNCIRNQSLRPATTRRRR
jgi:hypothetical protein